MKLLAKVYHVWWLRVIVLAVFGALLVGLAVWPQLSARATGTEYRLAVEPVDPIDPFRGAYVRLTYPGLNPDPSLTQPSEVTGRRVVYLPLTRNGDVWSLGAHLETRPARGPFLSCVEEYGHTTCGIESWFLPQDKAAAMQKELADHKLVAIVRIDARGNAALVDLHHR